MDRVVSVFCGCGGLDLAFREEGFDLAYACDNDPAAVDAYARNVDPRVHLRDVTSPAFQSEVEQLGPCEVVLGGFPCQGFSKAGPKEQDDPRNLLYRKMLHVVERVSPRVFVAENVDGVAQNYGGAYMRNIQKDFAEIGYKVDCHILDAAAYGVPQHRRRVFFVGIPEHLDCEFQWPLATHKAKARNGEFKVADATPQLPLLSSSMPISTRQLPPARTIEDAIGDLIQLDPNIPDHQVTRKWPPKYEAIFRAIGPGQKLCNVRHSVTSVYTWDIPEAFGQISIRERCILETIGKNRRHKRYGSIPNGNPLPEEEIAALSGVCDIGDDLRSLLDKGYLKEKRGGYDLKGAMFCSGLFKRPRWDEPSPTVLTVFHNPRYFLHPLQNRPFSLRECARLQGFPDEFVLTSREGNVDLVSGYRLIGNAVPPPLAAAVARSVKNILKAAEVVEGIRA
ncbi:MAG: DNA cytosine methyltransferase [Phycisphaerae bacterium]|nr:DNA cytosine methyltransferase [Planctomycetota bacterium]MBL7221102.1 DNA cytosine methyltransferase [Phycisphaerae bacterium]